MKYAIVMLLGLVGCDALDETANHMYDQAVCTENMCADDEVCVERECHFKCKVNEDCDGTDQCLPSAVGTLTCWDPDVYARIVGSK
jgi:hypothetical protein